MARQTAEQRKRSEAAKKAAETRRKNQEEEEKAKQAEASGEKVEGSEETRTLTSEEYAQQEHSLRVEHNARTGGGDLREGELQAQRDEHNRRTAGINV